MRTQVDRNNFRKLKFIRGVSTTGARVKFLDYHINRIVSRVGELETPQKESTIINKSIERGYRL